MLSFWQQPAYYRGIAALHNTGDGCVPQRLTDLQLTTLQDIPGFRQRSRCTAGCSLALRTDSPWIELSVLLEDSARDFAYFQLVADGSWQGVRGLDSLQGPSPTAQFRFLLPTAGNSEADAVDGLRHIELFFPTYSRATVLDARLAPGAAVRTPAAPKGPRLLAFGDSITQGADARHPGSAYPVQLARLIGGEVLNQGIGGHIFDPGLLDPQLAYEADLITVAYGINDWAQEKPLEQIVAQARQLLARIRTRYPGKPVMFITPIWSRYEDERRTAGTLVELRETLTAAVSGPDNVHVVDGLSLVPGLPHLFSDGVHPSDEGYGHYAVNLYRYWQQLQQR